MISTTTRCAFVDLESLTVDFNTIGIEGGFGGWDIHLAEPKKPMLALSTGLLTGTGAPGSGAVTWCSRKKSKLELAFSEGRIGPACRYAQIDHIQFMNKSNKLWDLYVGNGKITFSQAESKEFTAQEIFQTQNKRKPSADSVVVAFGTDGIVEDGIFDLGGAVLSGLFRYKGVNSLTVTGSGKIELFDSAAFLDKCVKLYQAAKGAPPVTSGRVMARYLSAQACNCGDMPDTVTGAAASLAGVHWTKNLAGDSALEALAGLLRSCSGKEITADMLGDSARRLMKEAKKMREGA